MFLVGRINKSMKEKIKEKRPKGMPRWEWREQLEREETLKEEYAPAPYYETPKESMIERILSGLGIGGLIVGGGLFSLAHFIFTAVVGLTMVWWAITEFLGGSVILGLVILFIGMPIAIVIANWTFIFLFPLAILTAILWGLANLFGWDISFFSVWDVIWLIIKVVILGGMVVVGIFRLKEAIETKTIGSFFKENWFYILLFLFLFWLFF